ncbi:MAG: HDIG domain-containing protein [Clostridia bacterium]|nr:HDIG domain-containing protein [Clostridia bacterium]
MKGKTTEEFDNRIKKGFWALMLFVAYVIVMAICYLAFFMHAKELLLYTGNVPLNYGHIIGFTLLVMLLFIFFGIYVFAVARDVLVSRRKICALLSCLIISFSLMVLLMKTVGRNEVLGNNSVFLAPLALCTMLVALLIDRRLALFSNVIVVMIFFLVENLFGELFDALAFYPLVCGVLVGVVANYRINKATRRTDYVLIGLYTGLLSAAVALTVYALYNNGFVIEQMLYSALYALCSGILSTFLFFVLVPLLEWVFNIVSDMRLAELNSSNQPLLKKLMREAPGTYHHCITVANYAEACASAIGADPFLARCAGLYHDIGKLKEPVYFVENQNDVNPHDDLTPEVSVMTIKRHTMYGLQIANEFRLPKEVKQAIVEHHGTMPIYFFLAKAQKLTEGKVNEGEYSYNGSTPSNKISAIVMIADACEAALKSLKKEDSGEAINIVDKIVTDRLNRGQFNSCDITMKELDTIKKTIISTFVGIKHERIKYPGQK